MTKILFSLDMYMFRNGTSSSTKERPVLRQLHLFTFYYTDRIENDTPYNSSLQQERL
jgi:hypothetical protein